VRALKDYFKLRIFFRNTKAIENLKPINSHLNIWPLCLNEWEDSLCGKDAIKNCIQISLLEKVFKILPRQKKGVYIMENQPWEFALLYAWRHAGHGILIGAPHTVIRYWDLRYHHDSCIYGGDSKNDIPLPDILAVNGPAAYKIMKEGNYPAHSIVEVEALRFLHLSEPVFRKGISKLMGKELHVLVLGDIMEFSTKKMLSWLKIVNQKTMQRIRFTFKPHPACYVESSQFHINNLNHSFQPIKELLAECDLVFASNSTSASLEAYCYKIPVIQMLDGSTMNLSPIRGMQGVSYISDPDQLRSAILTAWKADYTTESYFNLDCRLLRWKELLS
jgi:surface carbohydrate biosynthesis protein (TIGR04326 family)